VLAALLASLAVVGAALVGVALAPGRPAVRPARGASAASGVAVHGTRRALAVLGAPPAALALVYAATRPLIFPWYWPLALFPAVLGTAVVAVRWRAGAAAWPSRRARLAWRAAAAVAMVPVAGAAASAVETARDLRALTLGGAPPTVAVAANARTRTYLEIGAALAACRPGAVLAAEIGALGWTHRGRIIDGAALVSPEVLPFHPLRVPDERRAGTVGAYPARAVAALRPDLVVALEVFNSDLAAKAPADPALGRYAVLHARPVFSPSLAALRLPPDLWYSRAVLVLGDPARCPPAAFAPPR
jgi:hypothetical protein